MKKAFEIILIIVGIILGSVATVEAIPIEFIEKYAQLSDDAVALFGVPVGVLKNVYRSLIDEWRKENK